MMMEEGGNVNVNSSDGDSREMTGFCTCMPLQTCVIPITMLIQSPSSLNEQFQEFHESIRSSVKCRQVPLSYNPFGEFCQSNFDF